MLRNLSGKPSPCVIGEIGRLLASAEMLKAGIGVSRPEVDCGIDLISHSGSVTKLIQVKTRSGTSYGLTEHSETFKIGRNGNRLNPTYEACYLDAFVFVSLATNSFYVVPVSGIDLARTSVSLKRDCEWKDAWHLLKVGAFHA